MAEVIAAVTAATGGVSALYQIKQALWDPLTRKVPNSKSAEEILDGLTKAVGVLQSRKKDYENKVEMCKTKVPSETYKLWSSRLKKIEDEVKDFGSKYEKQGKNSCFFSPSSSALVKDMKRTCEEVADLWEQDDSIKDELFADPKLAAVVRNEVLAIEKFETLQKALDETMDLLKKDKVNGVGILGGVGSGKTTIMWNLNNHEEVAKMFDIVIWVKVSAEESKENLSRDHLQQTIVRRLKIDTEGTINADEVAERISMVLTRKKYLILFDDVKKILDLRELGIPGDNQNGSKFVITTRLQYVCSEMVDRMIKVRYLSTNEAWKMFQQVLRRPELIKNWRIQSLARRVCKECHGLPLFTEKVANTFKNKNYECLWTDGLSSWRAWPKSERQGMEEIYESLKFCYNDLDDDRDKECFLYGRLYPEESDIHTDRLVECWAAGVLRDNDCDARFRNCHHILGRLKSVSLLEKGTTENHVIMQKIMRQVALYIAEDDPDCKCLVKTSRELQEAPDVNIWGEKRRISLGDNKLNQLPESPRCPALSTLFLQKNSNLKLIPPSFFEHMPELRVMDLSHTGIASLPTSLSMLNSLEILHLCNCISLVELPSHIAELVHLEALDIQGSGVNNIPTYIEKLTRLRRLRVSFAKSENGNATGEVNFNYGTISKLSKLEELGIDVKSPELLSNEVVGNIINEVAELKELKSLKFCFANKVIDIIKVEAMPLHIRVPKAEILLSYVERSSWKDVQSIRSFQFFVGCQNSEDPQIPNFGRYDKYVKYSNGENNNSPILKVLEEADAIELVKHKEIKQLSDFGIETLNKVQGCLIESCDALETIVGTVDSAMLPNLEELYMQNLPKLESIWKGPRQPLSLTKLKTLVLTSCPMLVKMFHPSLDQHLCEIECLKIEECREIEEIISESDAVRNPVLLPKLKKLVLIGMPKLTSICANESLEWPSLKKLKVFKCPSLCTLPFNKDNAKKLKVIKAEERWWSSLQWQNQHVKEQLQRATKFGTLS